ncbi:MAG: rod shape-determining protein MreD [Bacteroidaceae bacterium]|nr:rod shape-determining protein MreD [Bacteroidaceae bacterium]
MSYESLTRLGRMLLMLAIQLMILNNIHLFGYATPLAMGYMILCFRCSASRISLVVWGFLTGLIFDLFSNTMGLGAASMTLTGFVQPQILSSFMPKDETDKFRPTLRTMGLMNYILYAMSLLFILHFTFYFLEAFSLLNFLLTLGAIFIGTLVATLLCVLIELIANERKSE